MDQLQLRRLMCRDAQIQRRGERWRAGKKRKLALKDIITKLESS